MGEICFNRFRGICKEKKCPRDYISNGHIYECPPGLEYIKEEMPELEMNLKNINRLEKIMNK